MTHSALILIATGSEETEVVTVYDLLVRAKTSVVTAAVVKNGCKAVKCSRGMTLLADTLLEELDQTSFDALILPGGLQGAEQFRDTPQVIQKIIQAKQSGRLVAAICATPAMVLDHHVLFPDAKMTGYPSTAPLFQHATYRNTRVCYDPNYNLITSQGPATSIDFALKIIEQLAGEKVAASVAEELILPLGVDDYSHF